ncbi:Uncharacterised protein [Mycobacteroides abscessus subsp. abscessus]|uniref:hypothetical protein n=1 Tax=Mycobacteroides abscessus TaxID=36809 RepID=UPI000926D5F2|nr:hypothetical protein [Mycobacteroides abscessus]SIC66613.1 Uncharacterised protein [Mycobacteroides abscessus subsp. abscessus]SIC88563.1 Uncharacterised protein [Mycobacteroides abscessus subsp. abscessus]SID08957.1 Uncharacterised protein [Mycobacteroides abscessus subsp. abscessus]SID41582.1 Uncharacterised protein [Mycobacteroides abscessus subsp. abscessus]SKT66538.1 Uncharacterised protein [Mycobacteroides abscessus subsp. abscessus]
MAKPVSPTFHITLYGLDLDAWREEFDMAGASDRQVLVSVKDYADKYINQHLGRLGVSLR